MFRAGHRPWTGGWPGTPWNSPGKQLTARADGAGAGRIAEFVHPDDSQQQKTGPPLAAYVSSLYSESNNLIID